MLKTSVERLDKPDDESGESRGSVIKLTVTVPADEVDRTLDGTYKRLSAKYRFPGFRPGKAPQALLDQKLGRDYILAEAAEEIVNTSYPLALDAEDLRPIESPELEELDVASPGEDYTYTAEIEVRPELTLASYDDFEIAMPEREATQADIDAQLEASRERFATLEPVEDRGVEVDDFVLISFVGTVDGESYEGNEVDKYLYEMNRGLMPPKFDEGIVGAKPGDDRKIEFVIPESSSKEDFIGKKATFDVSVHEIKSKKLPEIDDEFAGNMGGFDSVDDMVADLKGRIDLQKASAYERLKERRIREVVAQRLAGDAPEAMIVQRQSTMMNDFMSMLESRDISVEDYLASSGVDMDTVERDIRFQAEESVREDLGLEALARHKNIEVTDEDVEEELASVAEAMGGSVEDARARWMELGLMVVLREQILRRKAYEWISQNVSIGPETSADEADTEAGTKKAAPRKAAKKKASAKKKTDEVENESAEGEE